MSPKFCNDILSGIPPSHRFPNSQGVHTSEVSVLSYFVQWPAREVDVMLCRWDYCVPLYIGNVCSSAGDSTCDAWQTDPLPSRICMFPRFPVFRGDTVGPINTLYPLIRLTKDSLSVAFHCVQHASIESSIDVFCYDLECWRSCPEAICKFRLRLQTPIEAGKSNRAQNAGDFRNNRHRDFSISQYVIRGVWNPHTSYSW